MKRRAALTTIAYALFGCALLGCALFGCSEEATDRPNLLLITIDTLRADELGCYGGTADVGAAICGLAEKGIRYVWAISPAPATAPAIASILTSRYGAYHGVSELASTFLSAESRTLARELQDAGYATAALVANPVLNRARKLDQGFEIYDDKMTRKPDNRPGLLEREAAELTDAALAWAGVASEPWFLWVHYQDPHGPYEPPDAPPARDPLGAKPLPVLKNHSGRGGIPSYQVLAGISSPEAYTQRYLDEIRYVDSHVARLISGVDALGDPPAVVLTADHGEALGEDGYWFAHGHSLGLDQIRVPLVWRPPGGLSGREVVAPVTTLDVAPTLLRAAGLPIPALFQGRQLPLAEPGLSPGESGRLIFSEHRLRAVLVADGVYYARDRDGFDTPKKDLVSGGRLHPEPPRSARLASDGRHPDYEAAVGSRVDAALEPLLADFLDHAQDRTPPREADVSPELREQLRALGYLQ